jgi:LacI family transcriptional regulator
MKNILLALGWYYPEMHRGVARFARDHDWHVTADFDDPIPKHWRGDGVITLLGSKLDLWRQLRRLDVPIVDLAESRPNVPLPRVTMDNAAVGRIAAEHFLGRGFRNFAVIHRWDLGVSHRRRDSFASLIADAGYDCNILSWMQERGEHADTREQRHRWLRRRLAKLPKPMAVFAVRDVEGVEVIEACLSAGIEVPGEIAVLGVDNNALICDCLRVPLSSIDPCHERVGYEGAALLSRLLRGASPPSTPIYIPPAGIVQRRSTDSFAVEHPKVTLALKFIHENSHLSLTMDDVTRHVAMSRSGLEKAFREHFVRAPMQELRHIRIERAAALLRETKDKIYSVAIQTGFMSAHNLCRVFQSQFGMTPGEYRKQSLSEKLGS